MQLSDRIGSRMKLQDLHVLMTVVQAGSMGKAAQRLNTTQPNISRSISELEKTLGVRLLDRHRQGIEPTEYGRALLDCGVAVFDDLRQGVKNIEFLANPTAGEVRIGSTVFLAATFVSAVVDRLSRRYPRVVFHILTGYMETLHRELSERNVDLLIVRSAAPWLTSDLISSFFLMIPMLSWPARKAVGLGGAGSKSPNSQMNYGCCHRLKA
jgi:DNA-binding transcriptional LysR family regulator